MSIERLVTGYVSLLVGSALGRVGHLEVQKLS